MAPSLENSTICFIGGGNMAGAIIGGLLAKGVDKQRITVSEPWEVNRAKMDDLGVRTTTSNGEASESADIVILAVKPQVARDVCRELGATWTGRPAMPLLVSIVAGIRLETLRAWARLGDARTPPVVRAMPNTPALVGEGASAMFAASDVSADEKALAEWLIGSVSRATEWVDRDDLLNVVTGLSGSGPAYFFAMVEHLVSSATSLGLSREQASRLASQTCLGAGKMLVESGEEAAQLRRNVTSPNGTTDAALKSFEASGFQDIVHKAVEAATKRGEELGRSLASPVQVKTSREGD